MIPSLMAALGGNGNEGVGSPLSPPTNFNVSDTSSCASCSGSYGAYLTWTNADASYYTRIYRGGVLIATKDPGVTSHSDSGGELDTTNSYAIRHYDGVYTSPPVADSISPSPCLDNLSTPSSIGATTIGTTHIRLTPTGGGADCSTYKIYDGVGAYIGSCSYGSSYEHLSLTPGTQYSYRVYAASSTGCVSGSYASGSQYTKMSAPSPAASALSPESIRVSVATFPTGATACTVYRSGVYKGTISSPGGYVDESSLSYNTSYSYDVYATGTPPTSDAGSDSATTMPGVPTGLGASHDTSDCADAGTTVNLSWGVGTNDVDQIKVERQQPGEGSYSTIATMSVGSTSYPDGTADGSGSGTTYYRVSFVGRSGYSTKSLTVSCVPNAPTGVDASGGTSAHITWNDASSSPAETGFKIYRAPDVGGVPGSWSQVDTVGAGIESDYDYPADGDWHYGVASYNSWGTSSRIEAIGNPVTISGGGA